MIYPRDLMTLGAILIVDDDREMSTFLAEVIEDLGATAVVANSARACLDVLSTQRCLGIFLDIFMPDMDGIELIQMMAERGLALPTVVMSGHSPSYISGTAALAQNAGIPVVAQLAKPFSIQEAESAIETLLRVAE